MSIAEAVDRAIARKSAAPLSFDDRLDRAIQRKERAATEEPPAPVGVAEGGTRGAFGALKSGTEQMLSSVQTAFNVITDDEEDVRRLTKEAEAIEKTPEQLAFSATLQRKTEEKGDATVWQAIKNISASAVENPEGAFHEMLAQVPNMTPTLGGMYAGAATGAAIGASIGAPSGPGVVATTGVGAIVGAVVGMFIGNSAIETGFIAQEAVRRGEYDNAEVAKQGLIKGGVITGVDAASLGLNKILFGGPGRMASRAVGKFWFDKGIDVADKVAVTTALKSDPAIMPALRKVVTEALEKASPGLTKSALIHGTAMGIETVGEGVGEYGGSKAAGLDASLTDAVLESMLSLPHSAAEVAISKSLAGGAKAFNKGELPPPPPPAAPQNPQEWADHFRQGLDAGTYTIEQISSLPKDPSFATTGLRPDDINRIILQHKGDQLGKPAEEPTAAATPFISDVEAAAFEERATRYNQYRNQAATKDTGGPESRFDEIALGREKDRAINEAMTSYQSDLEAALSSPEYNVYDREKALNDELDYIDQIFAPGDIKVPPKAAPGAAVAVPGETAHEAAPLTQTPFAAALKGRKQSEAARKQQEEEKAYRQHLRDKDVEDLGPAKLIKKGEGQVETPAVEPKTIAEQQAVESGTPTVNSDLEATEKEPWKMTREEYQAEADDLYGKGNKESEQAVERFHRDFVLAAISEGKPVPAEVLKDYPELATKKEAKQLEETAYPLADKTVDGRIVRDNIPNTGSISATLTDYKELDGIRDVPFSAFTDLPELAYSSTTEKERTQDLADEIKESNEIEPLIVVIDKEGPYVLEGGHRFDALRELGAKSFPALVVVDNSETATPSEEVEKPEPAATEPAPIEFKGGNTGTADTESGQTINFRYAVVGAEDLIASHDDDLTEENNAYPQELQPRQRDRAAYRLQVEEIANNPKPTWLAGNPKVSEGAPVIGPDGVVESGNGRAIGLRKSYQNNKAENYKEWLLNNAGDFGLNKDDISGAKSPVLVRIRQTQMDAKERVEFTQAANVSGVATMSAAEQAIQDAQRLEHLTDFIPHEKGYIDTAANRDFIKRFLDKVVSKGERNKLIGADKLLTKEGISRIRGAIFALAYENPATLERVLESTDDNIRNITNAMLQAAPAIAKMKARIAKGELFNLDISRVFAATVEDFARLRAENKKVESELSQVDMFKAGRTRQEGDILRFLDKAASAKQVATFLLEYVKQVEAAGNPKQSGLFGDKPAIEAERVIESVLSKIRGELNEGKQKDLFGTEGTGRDDEKKPGTKEGPAVSDKEGTGDGQDTGTDRESKEDNLARLKKELAQLRKSATEGPRKAQAKAEEQILSVGEPVNIRGKTSSGDWSVEYEVPSTLGKTGRQTNKKYFWRKKEADAWIKEQRENLQNPPEDLIVSEGGVTYEVSETRVRDKDGNFGAAEPGDIQPAAAVQLSLFSTKGTPTPKPSPKITRYVEQVQTGTLKTGTTSATTPEEIAHITAPFRKYATEHIFAVVTGKDGKVLSVIKHSSGGTAVNYIFPDVLLGAIYDTPGAESAWLVHNHPSGEERVSQHDRNLSENISDLMKDTGIEYKGILAIGDKKATHLSTDGTGTAFNIPPMARTKEVPLKERIIRKRVTGETVGSSDEEKNYLKNYGEGVLLLSARHAPIEFIPMSSTQMEKLRTGEKGTGASKIWEALGRNTVSGVIIKVNPGGSMLGGENLARMAVRSGIQPLDIVHGDTSEADKGNMPGIIRSVTEDKKTFYSMGKSPAPTIEPAKLTELALDIREWLADVLPKEALDNIISTLQPEIEVTESAAGSLIEHAAAGKTGRILGGTTILNHPLAAVVEIAHQSPESMQETTYHEAFHVAAKWVLPAKQYAKLLKYFDGNSEKVADAFAEWGVSRRKAELPKGHQLFIRRTFKKLKAIFDAIRNGFKGKGFTSPEAIFENIWGKNYEAHFGGAAGAQLSVAEQARWRSGLTMTPNDILGYLNATVKKFSDIIGRYSKSVQPFNMTNDSSLAGNGPYPPGSQPKENSRATNSKLVSDIFKSKTFTSHGYGGLDVPSKRLVASGMLAVLQNRKVLNTIIKLVPVNMVDKLSTGELPSKVGLHDEPVFFDDFPVVTLEEIALLTDMSTENLVGAITFLSTVDNAALDLLNSGELSTKDILATRAPNVGSTAMVDSSADPGTAFIPGLFGLSPTDYAATLSHNNPLLVQGNLLNSNILSKESQDLNIPITAQTPESYTMFSVEKPKSLIDNILGFVPGKKAVTKKVPEKKTIEQKYTELKQFVADKHESIIAKQAEIKAFLNTMPIHVRGKSLTRITEIAKLKTIEGQQRALERAVKRAGRTLDKYLKSESKKEIGKILKDIKPRRLENRTLRGRLDKPLRELLPELKYIMDMPAEQVQETIEASNLDLAADPGFQGDQDARDQADMTARLEFALISTFGDFESKSGIQMAAAAKELKEIVKDSKQSLNRRIQAEYEARAINREEAAAAVRGGKEFISNQDAKNQQKKFFTKLRTDFRNFFTKQQSWEWLLDELEKFNKATGTLTGKLVETYGTEVQRATTRNKAGMQVQRQKVLDALQDIYGATGKKLGKILDKKTEPAKYTINIGSKTEKISKNEAIHRWMMWQNDKVREKLVAKGFGLDSYKQITEIMSENDKAWAQWMMDFYDDYYEGINEVYEKMYFTSLPKVKSYVPIRADKNLVEEQDLMSAGQFFSTMVKGSLKQRVEHSMDFRYMDADEVLIQHIMEMEHFKAWAEPVRDLRSVFSSQSVRDTMDKYHPGAKGVVEHFIDGFVRNGTDHRNVAKWMDATRSLFTKAVLAVNPVVFIKQLTSVPAFAMDMDAGAWSAGMIDLMSRPDLLEGRFRTLLGSAAIKERYYSGFERDMIRVIQRSGSKRLTGKKNISDLAMFTTRLGDAGAILFGGWPVYNHFYKQAKAAGKTEAEAHDIGIEEFEIRVARTQQAGDVKDLSFYQSKGSFEKLFSMFMTTPASYWRQEYGAVRNILYGRGKFTDNAKRFAIAHLLLPMLFQFVASGFQWDDDEMKRAAALGSLNGVFILRDFVQAIADQIFLGTFYGGAGTPPPFEYASDLGRLAIKAEKGDATIEDLSRMLAVTRVAYGLYELATGATTDIRRGLGYSQVNLEQEAAIYKRNVKRANRAIEEERAPLGLKGILKRSKNAIRRKSTRINKIKGRDKLTDSQKARIKKLQEDRYKLMTDFNKLYNEVTK